MTEQQQATPEQLMQIIDLKDRTIQDLANKLTQKEVENSQLRASYEGLVSAVQRDQQQRTEAQVVPTEEALDDDTEGTVPA